MAEEKLYTMVCNKCGYAGRSFSEKPNDKIGWEGYAIICPYCNSVMQSSDVDDQHYLDIFKKENGISVNEASKDVFDELAIRCRLIGDDYIKRHPEHVDRDARNYMLMSYQQRTEETRAQRQAEKQLPHCPNCGSTAVHTETKGFGVGKAIAGVAVTGSLIGAAAGSIGSGKVVNICKKCGHKWSPKK